MQHFKKGQQVEVKTSNGWEVVTYCHSDHTGIPHRTSTSTNGKKWWRDDRIRPVKSKLLTSFDGVKVGDKLKVREDLTEGMKLPFEVVESMENYAGKIVTVNRVRKNVVNLKELTYSWSPQMFEYIVGTQTISRNQAKEIINIACSPWRNKLKKEWSSLIVEDSVEVSQELIDEMFKAANSSQTKLLIEIFGSQEGEYKAGDWVKLSPTSSEFLHYLQKEGAINIVKNHKGQILKLSNVFPLTNGDRDKLLTIRNQAQKELDRLG